MVNNSTQDKVDRNKLYCNSLQDWLTAVIIVDPEEDFDLYRTVTNYANGSGWHKINAIRKAFETINKRLGYRKILVEKSDEVLDNVHKIFDSSRPEIFMFEEIYQLIISKNRTEKKPIRRTVLEMPYFITLSIEEAIFNINDILIKNSNDYRVTKKCGLAAQALQNLYFCEGGVVKKYTEEEVLTIVQEVVDNIDIPRKQYVRY